MMKLPAEDQKKLDELISKLPSNAQFMAGYPCNMGFDYTELTPILNTSLNNIGDPWQNSNYAMNTLEFERELLSLFGEWLHAPEDDMWGYVTGGGTEGNMYGLFLARELHPKGIVYYSEDTHYSVTKIIHVLGMRSIMIRSQENGEIDYDDLRETMRMHRDAPPILFCNIGTTMKQAVDDIPRIKKMLNDLAISQYYIHSDAAFPGGYFPFIDNAPPFDFGAGAHSISISGHKFIGSPVPCGLAMALKSNVNRIGRRIEYIGAMDTTIPGSRSAVAPLILWYAVKSRGKEGLRKLAYQCLEMAEYCESKMKSVGIAAWRNQQSLTIIFPRPGDHLIHKWSLAPNKDIAHVITVGHITKEIIDELVEDIRKDSEQPSA